MILAKYPMLTSGQTLWIRCSGPFSVEDTESYSQQVRKCARGINERPWVRVNDLREWELTTPEGMEPLNRLMVWCESHRLAHSINVMSNQALATFALNKIMTGVDRGSQRHMVSSLEEAFTLTQQLDPECDISLIQGHLYPKV